MNLTIAKICSRTFKQKNAMVTNQLLHTTDPPLKYLDNITRLLGLPTEWNLSVRLLVPGRSAGPCNQTALPINILLKTQKQ